MGGSSKTSKSQPTGKDTRGVRWKMYSGWLGGSHTCAVYIVACPDLAQNIFFGCQSDPKNVLMMDSVFQTMCMCSNLSSGGHAMLVKYRNIITPHQEKKPSAAGSVPKDLGNLRYIPAYSAKCMHISSDFPFSLSSLPLPYVRPIHALVQPLSLGYRDILICFVAATSHDARTHQLETAASHLSRLERTPGGSRGVRYGKVENVLRVGRGIKYMCILHSGLSRLGTEHFFGCQSDPKKCTDDG